jgi:hypothetical protein
MALGKKVSAGNIAANGGTLVLDVYIEGAEELTIIGDLGPTAAAAGDVTIAVQPFLSDYADPVRSSGGDDSVAGPYTDPALADAGLDLVQTTIYPGVAAYLANGHARVMERVQVSGFDKLRIVLTNHNASTALPGRIDYFVG